MTATTIKSPVSDTQHLTDLADLKRKSVRGGAVTFVSQGAGIVIQLVSAVILARLLNPEDYGIMAMVAVVTAFAGLFRDLGLSAAAIQAHTLTNVQQSNLFWLNVALGSLLTVGLSLASPLIVWFYHKPELEWVTVALSANFFIGSLSAQSGALLIREMRFGRQAVAGIGSALIGLCVSVILAFYGYRYWALVWGSVAGGIVSTTLLFLLSSFRPGWISRRTGVREMLKFGAHVTAFDFVNYFARNLDNILIGKVWGEIALGFYSRAYSLLMFPITNLRGPINAVAFPALSQLQNQPKAFRSYYIYATSILALLSMPLTAFLFVASEPIIEIVLGRKWLGVAPIFSWLALAGFIQPVSGFTGSVMLSLGKGRRYFSIGAFNGFIYCVSFVVGLSWGPLGVALSYAIANYVFLYFWMTWAFSGTPVSMRDFFDACTLPASASIISATLAIIVRPHTVTFPIFFQLAVSFSAFCVVICCTLFLVPSGRRYITFLTRILSQFKSVKS